MDFYVLRTKRTKEGVFAYPDFVVHSSDDLLVKGRAFYAIWDEEKGLWSRDEMDVARIVDNDLRKYADEMDALPMLMSSYESNSWKSYKQYVQSLEDSDVELDVTLNFADDEPDRKKYASRRLPYSLNDAECPAWDEIVSILYAPEERQKIEWSIGSILAGDSKKNQKFLVFYGNPGEGKGTIMNVVEKLFEGYTVPFDAKALTMSGNNFALAAFKNNPLVAIQQDGDLSRIEDNTRLNSLVSHEIMAINEKFKAEYHARAIAFLMMGTNEPVKITSSKSGILRRLIDCHPTGTLIPNKRYHILMSQIDFELGAIAQHCLGVYYSLGKNFYGNYRPMAMIYETDVFFNFIENSFEIFYEKDGTTLDAAWKLYKEFCEEAKIKHLLQRHQFRSELLQYFEKFDDRAEVDGVRVRSYYSGFKTHRFIKVDDEKPLALVLDREISLLDEVLKDMPAQYGTSEGTPKLFWTDDERMVKGKLQKPKPSQVVSTTLSDLDTHQLHFVKVPENHIVIDFDLKDENGEKSRERNLEAAAEWPPTYAEFSQGGAGIHLHYEWGGGDVGLLKPEYGPGIEVKTLLGNSSLRRRLTFCNAIPVATISSGLPSKEALPVQDAKAMSSEKSLRDLIVRNLRKEIHPNTKPSVEFIKKILEDAQKEGFSYDVSDLYPDVLAFAMDSTNNARYCMDLVKEMVFKSEDMELQTEANNPRLAFYDVEVFPNLFVICWKFAGDTETVRMINPSAQEVDELLHLRLIGYNCRRYDNHILYAAAMGYSVPELYRLSQRIVEEKDRDAFFGAAYDLSYTDIYDFAATKQSLKKWEIELGIHHMELGLPWDQPVPEDKWLLVADYCVNDVVATEAVFEHLRGDFMAREILADISGLSVNQTTQNQTARIVFGKERKPQSKFIYTNLSEMFPGYKYDFGKSTYRGEEVGEGGYVYAEPGYYQNVVLLDVMSMHPTSIINLNAFGDYTETYSDLLRARLAIKHGDFDSAKRMFDGKLAPYLEDEGKADDLSYALKIALNIVYGLTSASFENPFRDPRNKDNIVAKRGALFMIDLKHAVQEKGFTVAHIKTDSIKIPNATQEIIDFVFEFGRQYGYEFEHEATYSEFALFNDAVYIAKYGWAAKEKKIGKWDAVGAQFQHPYVFKKILTGEPIEFKDLCETRNVVQGEIYICKDDKGLDRRFVGRIGSFVPVLPDTIGGYLLRINKDKEGNERTYAVTGTKGWQWAEAERVQELGSEDLIDMSYFDELLIKAHKALESVGFPPWDPANEVAA